jgi:hypothetical protein
MAMAIAVAHYTAEHEPAVEAFNNRLKAAGVGYQFPASRSSATGETGVITRSGFVAVQDGHSVRGGYLLKEQDFRLAGQTRRVGYIHLPLSEGLIDRRYCSVGAQLLAHAAKRQPLLFGLGIGGRQEAFARLLTALGWSLAEVPFLFYVTRPHRVARHLEYLRRSPARALLLDLAAWTGAASLAAAVLQRRAPALPTGYSIESTSSFDKWADDLWQRLRDRFALAARRDADGLNTLYPVNDPRYQRLVLRRQGRAVGWAVVLVTAMTRHKYFGSLRVGTIVDCLADPAHVSALVSGVVGRLRPAVDLIVTNQSSGMVVSGLRSAGFLIGPSNFLLAASPRLLGVLGALDATLPLCHVTRGDGDGPINL